MDASADRQSETPIPNRRIRRWFRFSLATMFLVLTIGCIALGWIVNRAHNQRQIVARIRAAEGSVWYQSEEYVRGPNFERIYHKPAGPKWLHDVLGIDYFDYVTTIHTGNLMLTDRDLAQMSAFSKLRMLRIEDSPITSGGVRHLARLKQLEDISLHHTRVDDEGLRYLAKCPLYRLDLSQTKITGAGLVHFRNHPTLTELDLARTGLDDEGITHLVTVPNIDRMFLGHTHITDSCVEELAKYPSLIRLDVRETDISPEGIERLKMLRPQLDITY